MLTPKYNQSLIRPQDQALIVIKPKDSLEGVKKTKAKTDSTHMHACCSKDKN